MVLIERLARLGYIAKGVVYVVIGLLALSARTADKGDAIELINSKPFGKLALLIIVLGLLGYALWRVLSGIQDAEHHGRDLEGIAVRAGSVARGLFYAWFGFEIVCLLLHHGGSKGSDQTSRHWTARAMDHPFGRWAVAAAGLAILGYGGYQIYRAASAKVRDHLDRKTPDILVAVSRFGIAARAVIFGVIGVSLIRAAILYNPNAARGTSGAMQQIAARPFGGWLLVVIAIGLIAYGVYAFINARYRRIKALPGVAAARSQ
jgi:hypothetical protein